MSEAMIIERLESGAPDVAADRLESPAVATQICTDAGPTRYAELASRAADTLTDAGRAARARRLHLFADAARLDAGFLREHPERFVEVIDNRCRWYAGTENRFASLDRRAGREVPHPERVTGMLELLASWRDRHHLRSEPPRSGPGAGLAGTTSHTSGMRRRLFGRRMSLHRRSSEQSTRGARSRR